MVKYVEVFGSMGAGKTSLIKLFSEYEKSVSICESSEDIDKMHFVEQYLSQPEKYAFEGVLNFTANHLNRIKEALLDVSDDKIVFVDTSIAMGYSFAKPHVSESELEFIYNMCNICYSKLPKVDLRILCELPLDKHVDRLRKRGRDSEKNMTKEVLQKFNQFTEDALDVFGDNVPLLRLNSFDYNWVKNETDKETVYQKVINHQALVS